MLALVAALEPEFATSGQPVKVFRPHRDVRFAKDKTPYKTHQGAFVARRPRHRLVRRDLRARHPRRRGLLRRQRAAAGRVREAMAHDRTGAELEAILDDLTADGFEIGGDQLKTSPAGTPPTTRASTCCATSS